MATRTNLYHRSGELAQRHPALAALVHVVKRPHFDIPKWNSLDDAVAHSIIGQMLSTSAAHAISTRLYARFESTDAVLAWACRTASRAGPLTGVSQGKRRALRAWSLFHSENPGAARRWRKLSLADFRAEVSSIHGLGLWSADMLGIFYLARPDVWPETDTGLRRACQTVFGTTEHQKIRPHIEGLETLAALYLWELLNRKLETDYRHAQGRLFKYPRTK